jgi:hypothetical protein
MLAGLIERAVTENLCKIIDMEPFRHLYAHQLNRQGIAWKNLCCDRQENIALVGSQQHSPFMVL